MKLSKALLSRRGLLRVSGVLAAGFGQSRSSAATAFDRGATASLTNSGRVERSIGERPSPRDFGVVGDGAHDDTAAWQSYFNACIALGYSIACDTPLRSNITDTLVIRPAGLTTSVVGNVSLNIDLSNVIFEYSGARTKIVLDIGSGPSTSRYSYARIALPAVIATGATRWPAALDGNDTAVRLRRVLACQITTREIYGFTKGLELLGASNNIFTGMNIDDCKHGVVLTSEGASAVESYSNENTWNGGRIGHTSNAASLGSAYGVVFTWDKVSSYRSQNNNRFRDLDFELDAPTSPIHRVPFWFDGAGCLNTAAGLRAESCKGPIAILDGGNSDGAFGNSFEVTYDAGTGGYLLQVGGACGNILTGAACAQHSWHSGDMGKLVASSGGAGAYLKGREFYLLNGASPTESDIRRDAISGAAVIAHRNGVCLGSGGAYRVGVAIDANVIKNFRCSYASKAEFLGRPYFIALDAEGTILSGIVADATWGDEQYVKGSPITAGNQLVIASTGYTSSADLESNRSLLITVRDEVKTLLFMVVGGTTPAVVYSMDVTGYSFPNLIGGLYAHLDGPTGLRVFGYLDDPGEIALASANPAIAGEHGYYSRGAIVGSTAAASASVPGWRCTASGWLCPTWKANTVYAVPGMLVSNDSGKVYELTEAGRSAGSGGPRGTSSTVHSITDNTAKWRYIGTLATFAAEANLT